jgi:hypothetical protein
MLADGDEVRSLAGYGDRRLAALILAAQPAGMATGDGTAAAGQDDAGDRIGDRGFRRGARSTGMGSVLVRKKRCHGWLPPNWWIGVITTIIPTGPASVYMTRPAGIGKLTAENTASVPGTK